MSLSAKMIDRRTSTPRGNHSYGPFFLEYSLLAEYNLLRKQRLPGVYVIPSTHTPLCKLNYPVWINWMGEKIDLYRLPFVLPYITVLFRLVWNHIHSSRHLPRRHISFQNNHSWELSGWRLSGKKSIDESLLTLESSLFQSLLSMYWNIFHCILESIFWSSGISSSYWTTCTIWNGRPSWSFKKVAPQR